MSDDKLLNIAQAYNSIFSILDFSQQTRFPLSFFLPMPFLDELRHKKYSWDYVNAENREGIWQHNGCLFPFLSLPNVSTFKSVYPKNITAELNDTNLHFLFLCCIRIFYF